MRCSVFRRVQGPFAPMIGTDDVYLRDAGLKGKESVISEVKTS